MLKYIPYTSYISCKYMYFMLTQLKFSGGGGASMYTCSNHGNSNVIYIDDKSMAMVHVLPNNLDDLIANRMFLCLYYHRMLHGGLQCPVSGV